MIAFAPAKINIGLYVVGKRQDGYHNIVTCMVPINWFDVVEIVKANNQGAKLCVYGAFKQEVPYKNNTISRALDLMMQRFDISSVEIHLLKQIPSEAGLGGASSDAAATISLVDKYFSLNLSLSEKLLIAEQVGADVPFFIERKPVVASGKGERLEHIDLPWLKDYFSIVIVPQEKLSTTEMYGNIKQFIKPPEDFKRLLKEGPKQWKGRIINQFEPIAESLYPGLAKIKAVLYEAGADYASLTGSGSAYYGLFSRDIVNEVNNLLNYITNSITYRCLSWGFMLPIL